MLKRTPNILRRTLSTFVILSASNFTLSWNQIVHVHHGLVKPCSCVFGGKIKVTKLHATYCTIRPGSSIWTTITFYICTAQFNSIRRHALELPEPSSLEDKTIPMVVGHKAATSLFGIIAFVHCLIIAVDLLHCTFLFCIAFSSSVLIILIKSFYILQKTCYISGTLSRGIIIYLAV